MRSGYTVADAMTVKPITAPAGTSVHDIAVLMREKRVGSMLLTKSDEFVGIITEWDIVRRGVAQGLDLEKTPAAKLMTPVEEMAKVTPEMDLFEALRLMREWNVRHLPVLVKGKLQGFLTMKDVMKLQPQLFELIAEKYAVDSNKDER